jgi:putative membrane protein
MRIIAALLVLIVALSHVGFLVLEMFYWNDPVGRQVFETTPDFAASSAVLAANQGLYNGFLAAGLLWGLLSGRRDLKVFFLCCVIVAGVYGGLTAKMSILYIQGGPALAALLAVLATPTHRTRHYRL